MNDLPDISCSQMAHLIDEWVTKERDRRILKRRLIDGVCYEPLSDEFDLSVRRLKAIVYKWQEVIYRNARL